MIPEGSKISTENLFLILENEKDIIENWESVSEHMDVLPLHKYLEELISERNISTPEVGVKALLSRSFTYQIFSGDRVPSRNIILRIALALNISLDETQRLLKLADRGALPPKNKTGRCNYLRHQQQIGLVQNGRDPYESGTGAAAVMDKFDILEHICGEYELLSEIKTACGSKLFLLYDKVCGRKALMKSGKAELIENEARTLCELSGKGIPAVRGFNGVRKECIR